MNPTIDPSPSEQLVTTMIERIATLTRTLSTWMLEQEHSLAEAEQHVVRVLKELGSTLLAGVCSLAAPASPAASIPCSCGQQAAYQRHRSAQVTTLLGPISITRPYYLCAECGVGQHPLDTQLQFCAGSRSAALDELLALLVRPRTRLLRPRRCSNDCVPFTSAPILSATRPNRWAPFCWRIKPSRSKSARQACHLV